MEPLQLEALTRGEHSTLRVDPPLLYVGIGADGRLQSSVTPVHESILCLDSRGGTLRLNASNTGVLLNGSPVPQGGVDVKLGDSVHFGETLITLSPSTDTDEIWPAWAQVSSEDEVLASDLDLAALLAQSLAQGQTIGPYALLCELGRGGFGRVYRAWDQRLEREVALKVLKPASSDMAKRRFLREAKTTARVRHPHIVPIHDTGEEAGRLFLVMELIRGRNLEDFTQEVLSCDALAERCRRAVRVARDVARALQHAHDQGVLHRDIKPINIMIDEHDHATVLDFGLAHLKDGRRLTGAGTILGTALYMAPEQAAGEPPGPGVDVYALGATLYFMIAGQSAFPARSFNHFLDLQAEPVPPPSEIAPGVPPRLDAIVLRSMERNLHDRYRTAADLADDLESFLAAPDTPPETTSPQGHVQLFAGLLGVTVVVFVALLGLLLTRDDPPPTREPVVQTPTTPPGEAKPEEPPASVEELIASAREAAEAEDLTTALASVREARIRDPESLIAVQLEAELLTKQGDPRAAVEVLNQVLPRKPTAELFNLRAQLHYTLGDARAALSDWSRALERNPSHHQALSQRGSLLVNMGRDEPGLRDLDRALAVDPDHHPTLVNHGKALFGLREFERALADFERARVRAPDDASLLVLHGRCLRALRREAEALPLLERAASLAPDDPDPSYQLGLAYLQGRRTEDALRVLNRSLELAPNEPKYLVRRGEAYAAQGNHGAALPDFEACTRLAPGSMRGWLLRANTLKRLGRLGEVLAVYDACLTANPRSSQALTHRGWHKARELRRVSAGLADLDAALSGTPPFALAHYFRAALRVESGDRDGAAVDLRAFLASSSSSPYAAEARSLLEKLTR